MSSSGVPKRTDETSAGRNSSGTGGKRPPGKTSRRSGRGAKKLFASGSRKFSFLPLFTLWMLAIVVLGGLIYWGENSAKRSSSPGARVATSSSTSEKRPSSKEEPQQDTNRTKSIPVEPPSAQPEAPSSRDDTAQIARQAKPKGGDRDPETHSPAQIALSEEAETQHSSKPTPAKEERSTPAPHADSPLPPFKEIAPAQRSIPPTATSNPERAESPAHKEKLSLALNRPEPLAEPSVKPHVPPPAPPATVARVAIVIDDFGQDLEMAKKFLEIPLPITFSVLPYQSHSKEISQLAHDRHREVLLHLPMEPHGYPKINPGNGALLLSMNQGQMQQALESALDSSPFASGVNNHMGSRFTEDSRSMKILLRELQGRNLYFLDSYTSPKSAGLGAAREFRMPVGRRDIFLDHEVKEEFTRAQIQRLIRKAKIQGTAIAIGHPHDSTLRVLRESAGTFREAGIAVVPAGQLVTTSPPAVPRK
jgi:polysaccharide deacetylase 2 family uncharacterized protein YibQ/cytoskeletal protein RodZ